MKTTMFQMKSLFAKCDYHNLAITWTSSKSSINNDANNVYLQYKSFHMKAGCSLLELSITQEDMAAGTFCMHSASTHAHSRQSVH